MVFELLKVHKVNSKNDGKSNQTVSNNDEMPKIVLRIFSNVKICLLDFFQDLFISATKFELPSRVFLDF